MTVPILGISEQLLLDYLIGYQLCSFLLAFFILSGTVIDVAPYGRYTKRRWWYGPNIPARASWVIQELPALAIPILYVHATGKFQDLFVTHINANTILLVAVSTHYTYRALIYPMLIRGGKPSSLITTQIAAITCLVNGLIHALAFVSVLRYPADWMSDARFIGGLVLFVVGLLGNIQSDSILRNLRKPGETGYKIPTGGLFEYVSAANYLSEIVEWTGLALAGWSVPTLVMVTITVLNLVPRALTHHKWYQQKFEKYPPNRKALIPFLL